MTSGVDLERTLAEDEEDDQGDGMNLVRSFSDGELETSLTRGGSITNSSYRRRCGSSVSKSSVTEVIEEKAAFAEEDRTKGAVSGRIYWDYFRAGGGALSFILLAASCIVTQVLFSGTDYWLTLWTDAEEVRASNSSDSPTSNETRNSTEADDSLPARSTSWMDNIDTQKGVYVYTILLVGLFIFSMIRSVHFFVTCMSTSINLHNNMFDSVIRAPVLFFDKNPIGRILNRFTKDIGCMDEMLPSAFFDVIIVSFRPIACTSSL